MGKPRSEDMFKTLLCALMLSLGSRAEQDMELPTAALEMFHLIKTNESSAHITTGGFVAPHATLSQLIGACYLDKANFVIEHNVMDLQPKDLAIDLAACCTIAAGFAPGKTGKPPNEQRQDPKLREECIQDISPAYDLIHKAHRLPQSDFFDSAKEIEIRVVSSLVPLARSRLCDMSGKMLHCPSFHGDEHDLNLLKLCMNVQPRSDTKCDPKEIEEFVKQGSEAQEDEDEDDEHRDEV